ncbi:MULTISPECIES: peptidylprolyl isomerase [Maribacter]|uniref:Peptidyl-prolyl cis-trans isomerase n=1 Tax=Maribacter flavus TaxID=1658664 RepID=A0ABU7ILX4_9FLAO|nr:MULTISPECIES: peptidylprolyl isomerase [Maribacter]MDC6406732.1 peptidylprolyl isomerase [Maribacter sp. PR66]MEE1973826.1 peptidylprolyl isomerase [Maribacter flavus]
MRLKTFYYFFIILTVPFIGCKDTPQKPETPSKKEIKDVDSSEVVTQETEKADEDTFELTEENAIDFFFDYQKDLKANKVKMTTKFGSFIIQLYDDVPYHKANFIYLTRKGYFDYTQFHRVVKDFIIQGGSSDDQKTADKRWDIGRYLLPPDTKKGYSHHRGTVSMPSSEMDNPHKLASPYEFFIVVTDPGSYHLDGDFTPFGKVIEGMDVVDKINAQPVGKGDWPQQNIYITKAEVIE